MFSRTLTALALIGATPLAAQDSTVFNGQDAVADNVEAIEEQVQDDFDRGREARDFGPNQGRLGWSGSLAATANATSGNTDTAAMGIGARLGYFDGTNGHDFRLSYRYAEDEGDATANTLAASYDYSRFFTPDFFAFGKLSTKYDEFGPFERDSFVGAGIGYRFVNTADVVWSVQAGPGFRVAEESNGNRIEEAAGLLESKLFWSLSDDVFLSNDTAVLFSEADTAVSNDLGLNVSLNRALALRTSLRSEYHSDPLPGAEEWDHALGVSLVYSFN